MKTIFIVDDNDVNLLSADETLSEYYRVYTMPSASNMFELLENVIPDLILLDILMPEMDGFETLKILKENPAYAGIPVIFLSGRNDVATESHGFEMGVVDFISKPFSRPVLLNRIKTHLGIEEIIHKRTDNIKRLKNAIVSVLANMMESRDKMTSGHLERTTKYIKLLIDAMLERKVYYDEIVLWDLDMIFSSSRLHDIGKIVITDLILNKPSNLTHEEFDLVKTHAAEGIKIIDSIIEEAGDEVFLQYAKLFAGYHHERWDGTGYPHGLSGTKIPLQARVMAIADVYDALRSNRPYKKAFSHEETVNIIKGERGTQFDPMLVDIFLVCGNTFEMVSLNKETYVTNTGIH